MVLGFAMLPGLGHKAITRTGLEHVILLAVSLEGAMLVERCRDKMYEL